MAIVLKITLGDDTRRISFENPLSYEELTQIVKQLFSISVVQLKYEDEDKDKITVTSQIELDEAYQIASRYSNNVLRVFVFETPVASLEANFLMKFLSSINLGTSTSAPADVVGSPAVQEVLTRLGLSSPSPSRSSPSPIPSSPISSKLTEESPTVSIPVADLPRPTTIHRGVTCDGCKTENIPGIRYKCTVCHNYDLCENCKGKGDEIHPSAHVMTIIHTPVTYGRRGHCYRIPASIRTSVDASSSSSTSSRPVATFIKHVNYHRPDVVAPGTKITKTWRVRNDGQTVWPVGTVLVHVGGSEVPVASRSVLAPLAAPGEEIDVSVDIIMPPQEQPFISFWRLSTADGDRFGKRMRACFIVPKISTCDAAQTEKRAKEQAEEAAKEAQKQAKEAEQRARVSEEAAKEAEKQAEEAKKIAARVSELAAVEAERREREIAEATRQAELDAVAKKARDAEEAKNSAEAIGIIQLTEFGLTGDLLAVLRKNGGDVNAAALELLGGH